MTNFVTWQTSSSLPMQDSSVVETVAGATFPTGFSAVAGGTANVMVIIQTDAFSPESGYETNAQEALDRIKKKLHESLNLN